MSPAPDSLNRFGLNPQNNLSDSEQFFEASKLNAELPRVGPAEEGIVNDPSRTQKTLQGTWSNWVNSLSNMMDQINEGPAQHRLIDLQNEKDLLDEQGPNADPAKQQDIARRMSVAQQEIQDFENNIKGSPVDMDYQIEQNFRQQEEWTNIGDYVTKELPTDLGGSLSQWKLQAASMVTPMALQWAGEGAAMGLGVGSAVGTLVGLTAGMATSLFLMQKSRAQETDSEIQDAYQQKMINLTQDYMLDHPNVENIPDEDLRKMRIKAHEGLKQLNDKNMSLMVGDVLETLMLVAPWFKTLRAAGKGLEMSRAGRNILRAGALAGTMLSEGIEEGKQWLWQQNYLNDKDVNDGSPLRNYVEGILDTPSVGLAMFGKGDPSMYTSKDFRNSVRSGAVLGGLMDGAIGVIPLIGDHIAYNKTLSELSSEGAKAVDNSFTKVKAETLYKLFKSGKAPFIYDALKALGHTGINGFDVQSAAEEAQKIQDLHKDFEHIQNPTSGPFKLLWNSLDQNAKTKQDRINLETQKQMAFYDTVMLKHTKENLSKYENVANNPDVVDNQGFISELYKGLEGEVGENFKKLGLDPETSKRLSNDRFDTLIAATNSRIKSLTNRIEDTLSGKNIIKVRERSKLDATLQNYDNNQDLFIEHYKEKDGIMPAIAHADNQRIKRDLKNPDTNVRNVFDKLDSLSDLPLSQDTYNELEKVVNKQTEPLERLNAQYEQGLDITEEQMMDDPFAFDESLKRREEIKRQADDMLNLRASLDKVKSRIVPDFNVPDKTDNQYKRQFADNHFRETDLLDKDILDSEQNIPFERTTRQLENLNLLKDIYEKHPTLNKLAEFKGFKELLAEKIKKTEEILKEIERRMHDRNIKNERIAVEVITGHYSALGANLVVNTTTNEITLEKGSNEAIYNLMKSVLGDFINKVLNAATEEYKVTKKLNEVYPQLLLESFKAQATAEQKNTAIIASEADLEKTINEITKGFKYPFTSEFTEALINNPEHVWSELVFVYSQNGLIGKETLNYLQSKYFKDRSLSQFRLNVPEEDREQTNILLGILERSLAFDNFRTTLTSSFKISNQVKTEKVILDANPSLLTPSKEQLNAAREMVKWVTSASPTSELYSGISYLSGFAGTGKTFVAGLVRRFLGLADNQVYVAAHSKEAFETIAKSVGVNVTGERYKTTGSTIELLTEQLKTKSNHLSGVKVVFLDEMGFLTVERMEALATALKTYNEGKDKETAIRILGFGDAYQLREKDQRNLLENNAGNHRNIRIFKPLTVVFRTGINDITTVGNAYLDNKNPVKELKTRATGDHTAGVVTSKDSDDIYTELEQKNRQGLLKDNKKRVVVVNTPEDANKALARLKGMPVDVKTYIDVQGSTYDEVYVDITKTGNLNTTDLYNRALYTAVTRATTYVMLVDKQLEKINKPLIRNDLSQSAATDLTEFANNKVEYKNKLESDLKTIEELGFKPVATAVPVSPTEEPVVTSTDPNVPVADDVEESEEPHTEETLKADEVSGYPPVEQPQEVYTVIEGKDWELHFPQAVKGELALNPGDQLYIVKSVFNNEIHARIVKLEENGSYTLIGIIGTKSPDGKDELSLLTKQNPALGTAIKKALEDETLLPTRFDTNPANKATLNRDENTALATIAFARVKSHTPFTVNFDDNAPKQMSEELRERIKEDVRTSFLRTGQVAKSINVKATVYTNEPRLIGKADEGLTDSVKDLPDHQKSWVKVGRPYLRVTVEFDSGRKTIFNIPSNPKVLDYEDPHVKEFLDPLIEFTNSVMELENLYHDELGDNAPIYGSEAPSGVTAGKGSVVSKGELFRKSIFRYPGSTLEDIAASSLLVLDPIEEKLSKSPNYPRIQELRKLVHTLAGIKKYKSLLSPEEEENLTEEDKIPEHITPVFTKTTNKEFVKSNGTDIVINGFYVMSGDKGLIGVRYVKYKGLFFKFKMGIVSNGTGYASDGKYTYNIQSSLNTDDDEYMIARNRSLKNVFRPYDAEMEGDELQENLELLLSVNKEFDGYQEGSGAAQAVIRALAKNNEGVPIEDITFPIRIVRYNKQGQQGGYTGKSLLGFESEVKERGKPTIGFNSLVLFHMINNPTSKLRKPVKIIKATPEGDNINVNDIFTNYSGIQGTSTVIGDFTGPDSKSIAAPATATEETEQNEKDKKIAELKAKRKRGNDSSGYKPGKALLKRVNSDLGEDITINEAIRRIKKLIPEITEDEIHFVNEANMLQITEGESAWGYFKDGALYLLKNPTDNTVKANILRHEVFHRLFNMNLTASERAFAMELARKYNPQLRSINSLMVEEWLAEQFQKFIATKRTKFSKLRELFNKLLSYLGFLNKYDSELKSFFNDLDSGKYTRIRKNVSLARTAIKVRERFGSVDNFIKARQIALDFLYRQTNIIDPKPVEIENGRLINIPISRKEAEFAFIEHAQSLIDLNKESEEAAKTEKDYSNLPYYAMLLDKKLIDGKTNLRSIIDGFYREDLIEGEIDEVLRELLITQSEEQLEADLTQEINAQDLVDLETKVSSRLKDFLSNIWVDENHVVPNRFAWKKTLDILGDINTDQDNLDAQLEYQFYKNDPNHPYVNALFKTLTSLKNIKNTDTFINSKGKTEKLPDAKGFIGDDNFIFTDGNGAEVRLFKNQNDTTSDFYKTIHKVTGYDYNAIRNLYRRVKANEIWNEVFAHFPSQREKSPYGITIDLKYNSEVERNIIKFLPFESESASIKTAIEGKLEDGLRNALSTGVITSEYINKFKKANQDAKLVSERIVIMKRFFQDMGIKNISGLSSNPNDTINGVNDIIGLLSRLVNFDGTIDQALSENKGSTDRLSAILAINNENITASNYIDKSNRKRYKHIFHSGATKVIRQIINHFDTASRSDKFKDIFQLPTFVRDNTLKTNQNKHNIYLSGINKIYEIYDYDAVSTKDDIYNDPIEYADETPLDVLNRKFNGNFVGALADRERKASIEYLQSGYTVSNKPSAFTVRTNVLSEKEMKAAIKSGLQLELERNAYVEELEANKQFVENVRKNANVWRFIFNGEISKTQREEDIDALTYFAYNTLITRAKESYKKNKDNLSEKIADSRMSGVAKKLENHKALYDVGSNSTEAVYITYYINNYVNGHHLAHLYLGDSAFTKNNWDDYIKRLQSTFGMGKMSYVGQGGMKRISRIAVAEDEHLLIDNLSDYTNMLQKLYKDTPYDATDGQMYVLPSYVEELKKGGHREGAGNILKPIYYGKDKYGIPRLLKTSAIALTPELIKMFPELRIIKEHIEAASVDGLIFRSGVKVGIPSQLSNIHTGINENSILELDNANMRIQLNPISKIDNEVANFSQLLYALNVNKLNKEKTDAIYGTNATIIKRGYAKLLRRITGPNGQIDIKKLRNEIKDSLIDKKKGVVTSGSERIYELLDDPNIDINLPSLLKKVIVQLMSSVTNNVTKIDFSGSKLVLTTAAPIKIYRIGDKIHTFNTLFDKDQTKANNFYTQYSPNLRAYLIKAQEAKLLNAVDTKFSRELERSKLKPEEKQIVESYLSSGEINDVLIPHRLRLIADPLTKDNYAEVIMPIHRAIEIANRMGIALDDLRRTSLGVRIPTSGIHSSIPIRIVATTDDTSNIIVAPEEIVPLHGSDFDVDSLFVLHKEIVQDGEGTGKETGELWFNYKQEKIINAVFEEDRQRRKEKYGQEYDEVQHRKEFANKSRPHKIWYNESTNRFERYVGFKGDKTVVRGVPRPLTAQEITYFTNKLPEVINRKQQELSSKFNEKRAIIEFAASNGLNYNLEEGRFISVRPLIAMESDLVGYKHNMSTGGWEIDADYDKMLEHEIQLAKEFVTSQDAEERQSQVTLSKKTINALEHLKDKYYRNFIIQNYLDIITDEKNREDMLTSINQKIFEDDIFPKLRVLYNKTELLGTKDLNDHDDQTDIQMLNMAGRTQVGAIANTMKTLSYHLASATQKGLDAIFNMPEYFTIGGKTITKIENNEQILEGVPYKVWESFDSLLNSAIDNVKDQRLGILNLTDITGNAFCMMVASGIPMETIVYVMNQISIKSFSNDRKTKTRNAKIDDMLKKSEGVITNSKMLAADSEDFLTKGFLSYLNNNVLSSNIGLTFETAENDLEFYKIQYAVLKLYKAFDNIGKQVFNTSRGLTILRNEPITYEEIEERKDQLETSGKESYAILNANLIDVPESNVNPKKEGLKHIQEVYTVNNNMKDILSQVLYQHNPEVEKFIDDVIKLSGIKLDFKNKYANKTRIKEELVQYLLSSYPEFANDPNETFEFVDEKGERKVLSGNQAWIQKFVRQVSKYAEKADNEFLNYLVPKSYRGVDGILQLSFQAGTALNDDEKLIVGESFEKLPEDIQKGLLKYAILMQGLSFGVTTYSIYISPDIQKGISEFLGTRIKGLLSGSEKMKVFTNNFTIQLATHNPLALRYISNTKTKTDYVENSEKDKDSTWDIAITSTTEDKTPFLVRIGFGKDTTVYVRTSLESKTLDEEKTILTAKYVRLAKNTNEARSAAGMATNIYYANEDALNGNWKFEDAFNPKLNVRVANPKYTAAGIEGKNVIEFAITGNFKSDIRYRKGDLIYLRDAYDIMRSNLIPYTVDTIVESTGKISYLLQKVEPAKKEFRSGVLPKSYRKINTAEIHEQYQFLADIFNKKGFKTRLVSNPQLTSAARVFTDENNEFVIEYNPLKEFGSEVITHEFGHILGTILKLDPQKWSELIEWAKVYAPALWTKVQAKYNNYEKQDQEEELIMMLLGEEGHKYFENKARKATFINKVRAAIRVAIKWLMSKFKPEEENRMRTIFYDMLEGKFSNNFKGNKIERAKEFKTLDAIAEAFIKAKKDVTLTDDQENYYNNETKVTYDRVNPYIDKNLSPFPEKTDWAVNKADEAFKYIDKQTGTIVATINKKEVKVTYDEYLEYLKKSAETEKVRGKIIHKIIEWKYNPREGILDEIKELAKEKPGQNAVDYVKEVLFIESRWSTLSNDIGIFLPKNSKMIPFSDEILNEAVVYNDALKLAGTVDIIVRHSDGTYTLADFKTGMGIINTPIFVKLMKFAESNGELPWTNMTKAKMQLMLYALLMKSMDRSITFRDLKVVHLSRNADNQIVHSVEFRNHLGILNDFIKQSNPEFYEANKDLFDYKQYGGSMIEVDRELEKTNDSPQALQAKYVAKARQLQVKSLDPTIKRAQKLELEDKAEEYLKNALQLEVQGEQIFQKTKDIGALRRWFDNLKNAKDPTVQAFARFLFGRKNAMNEEMNRLKLKHESFLQPVLHEYLAKNPTKKALALASFGQFENLNYTDLYGFLFSNTAKGRRFRVERGDMTDAQWKYSQYIRKDMRNQFYLTANPKELLRILKPELENAVGEEKAEIEALMKIAEEAPNVNKLKEYDAFKGRNFSFEEDFIPYVPATTEEMMEKGLNKSFFGKYLDDTINKYSSTTLENSILRYGLPFKFLGKSNMPDELMSTNGSLIYTNFMVAMVQKRYLDDVYSLGNSLLRCLEVNKDTLGEVPNMIGFLKDQILLHTLDYKRPIQWLNKEIYIAGRKVKLDAIMRLMRSFVGGMTLILRWKGGIVNGFMETMFNYKAAITGSVAKQLKVDPKVINFTIRDLAKANVIWQQFQYDRIAGKDRDNKVWNLLRKFDYQTDNYAYPTNKDQIMGIKNKALQWSTLFNAHQIFEQQTNGTVLIAQMLHDGTWDKYDNHGEWKGGLRGVDKKGNKIYGYNSEEITKLKKVSEYIHGSYRLEERCAAELTSVGSWLIQFKKYLPNALHAAWASKYNTFALGQLINTGKTTKVEENGTEVEVPIFEWESRIHEGAVRTAMKWTGAALNFNKIFFTDSKNGPVLNYEWKSLSPEQQQNVINVYVQVLMFGTLLAMVGVFFEGDDDNDEWKRRFGRVPGDLIQGWNILDLLRAGVSPTIVMPRLYKFTNGIWNYSYNWVADNPIKHGEHKGSYIGAEDIKKNIPVYAQFKNLFPDNPRP